LGVESGAGKLTQRSRVDPTSCQGVRSDAPEKRRQGNDSRGGLVCSCLASYKPTAKGVAHDDATRCIGLYRHPFTIEVVEQHIGLGGVAPFDPVHWDNAGEAARIEDFSIFGM